jgi:hypothetical protein
MIVCACANCQTSTIPSVILDSLIYETKKGRECGNLSIKQQIEINAITAQLTTQGKIISLKDTEVDQLRAVVATQSNELLAVKDLHGLEKARLKAKLKRLWRVVIIEGAGVIILVVLII